MMLSMPTKTENKYDRDQYSGLMLFVNVLKEQLFGTLGQSLGHRPFGYFFDEGGVIFIERIEFGDATVGF